MADSGEYQPKRSSKYGDEDEDKNRTWVWILIGVLLFCMFAGILIPFVLEYSAPYYAWRWEDPHCPAMMEEEKMDCYPEDDTPNWYRCLKRGCCWYQSTTRAPSCYMAMNIGYNLAKEERKTVSGYQFDLLRRQTPRVYSGEIWRLRLDIEMQTNERLRVKFYDPGWKRYEPPIDTPQTTTVAQFPLYRIDFTKEPFTLQIRRRLTDTVVFNTSLGGLYFSAQYLTISSRLPSENFYGLGENRHGRLQHMLDKTQKNLKTWHIWAMHSRNQYPDDYSQNLYGQFPYYVSIENDGNAHGVLLLNSNAMEASLTPLPSITYRTTGGVLDFWFFFGPTPEKVTEQYCETVGRPVMPPYWSLGFHLSRWGYDSTDRMKYIADRNRLGGMPFDGQFADVDYLDHKREFTLGSQFANLQDYIDNVLHRFGYRCVLAFHAGIASETLGTLQYDTFQTGLAKKVYITKSDNATVLYGESWPGWVAYPDFDDPVAQEWYKDEVKKFYMQVPFDGMWLKNNEPDNFRHGDRYGCWRNWWNYPPYIPRYSNHSYQSSPMQGGFYKITSPRVHDSCKHSVPKVQSQSQVCV
ncbi:sucrase-isomaltase, intestinal-like [Glandiceps talaboti]